MSAQGPARRDLSPWLWLVLPPLLVGVQYAAKLVSEDFFQATMKTEQGFVENGTVALLLVAVVLAVLVVRELRGGDQRLLRAWMWVFALGCFLFAGEEVSWGQHWFHWRTPEAWAAINPRGETSIHNRGGLYNSLPRTVLTVGALAGGLVLPALYVLRRRRGDPAPRPRGFWGWAIPTYVCIPTVLLALVVTLPKKLYEDLLEREMPRVLAISPGETKELLLALFLLLYVASLLRRLRLARDARPAAATGLAGTSS